MIGGSPLRRWLREERRREIAAAVRAPRTMMEQFYWDLTEPTEHRMTLLEFKAKYFRNFVRSERPRLFCRECGAELTWPFGQKEPWPCGHCVDDEFGVD